MNQNGNDLVIAELYPGDSGTYMCTVKEGIKRQTHLFQVTVHGMDFQVLYSVDGDNHVLSIFVLF